MSLYRMSHATICMTRKQTRAEVVGAPSPKKPAGPRNPQKASGNRKNAPTLCSIVATSLEFMAATSTLGTSKSTVNSCFQSDEKPIGSSTQRRSLVASSLRHSSLLGLVNFALIVEPNLLLHREFVSLPNHLQLFQLANRPPVRDMQHL